MEILTPIAETTTRAQSAVRIPKPATKRRAAGVMEIGTLEECSLGSANAAAGGKRPQEAAATDAIAQPALGSANAAAGGERAQEAAATDAIAQPALGSANPATSEQRREQGPDSDLVEILALRLRKTASARRAIKIPKTTTMSQRTVKCVFCREPMLLADAMRSHGVCRLCSSEIAELGWRTIYDRDLNLGEIPVNLRRAYQL